MDAATTAALRGYDLARPSIASGAPGRGTSSVADAATEFVRVLDRHEETARAAMVGEADPHALVQALAASQMAVEMVSTLRDRVVEAYQEILRMPI